MADGFDLRAKSKEPRRHKEKAWREQVVFVDVGNDDDDDDDQIMIMMAYGDGGEVVVWVGFEWEKVKYKEKGVSSIHSKKSHSQRSKTAK